MRHSRKLGAAQQRSYALLKCVPTGIESLMSDMAGSMIRRRSPRSKRYAWYARTIVDGRMVERFVADENGLSCEQVAAMRRVTGTARRRATAVRRLVKAGFPVPPARIVAMLNALAPALGDLVLVDDWAPMLYAGLTGYTGYAFEELLVHPPLSFVLGAGQSVDEVVDLLELSGGDWLATPQDLRGVTRITGSLGTIILYDRNIGAPATQVCNFAQTGAMLTGHGLHVKVLSPVDQVFWDAWRASMNGADANLRRARSASLAPWAAEVDVRRQPALQWWMDFAPGVVRVAIRSFAAPTQALLNVLLITAAGRIDLPGATFEDQGVKDRVPIPADSPVLDQAFNCPEWTERQQQVFFELKDEVDAARAHLAANTRLAQGQLHKAKAADVPDPVQIAVLESDLAIYAREERACTRQLSMKITALEAKAQALARKARARVPLGREPVIQPAPKGTPGSLSEMLAAAETLLNIAEQRRAGS
jgi:hypothetical protein